MEIAILGGGSWGIALAMHLAKKGYSIKVWEFFEEDAKKMQENRFCRLLPEVKLPQNVIVSSKMEEVLSSCELILLVVPSDKVKSTMEKAKAFLEKQPIVICSKGLGENLELMTDLVGEIVSNELFCFYGPTHAEEVCKGMFSGAVLAGEKKERLKELKKILETKEFKVEISEDLVGVQIGAALKNIMAVFIGVLEGMNWGDNAKAYVMTKGLDEIKRVGLRMGAKPEIFYGLAGMGDLIVTCMSRHSRNRYLGEQVGKGRKLIEVIEEMEMVAEGVTTVKRAVGLKEKLGLDLPLITGLHTILFEGGKPEEALKNI